MHKGTRLMYIPSVLIDLIKSFLPPPTPYCIVRQPAYFTYDYVYVEDWEDIPDYRQYGDF
jgi:hypothetical protein